MSYKPQPTIFLLGDSLIEKSSVGLIGRLQDRYARRFKVVAEGLSGYNTDWTLQCLPELIPPPSSVDIRYFIILLGANDACIESAPTNQQVPLDRYKSNLVSIIKHPLVQAHKPRIILCTPPPIDETLCEQVDASKGMPLCRYAARSASFGVGVVEVIRELTDLAGRFMLLDLWNAIYSAISKEQSEIKLKDGEFRGDKAHPNLALQRLVPDGLHFSTEGYALVYRTLVRSVEAQWPTDGPHTAPFMQPEWRVLAGLPASPIPSLPPLK